MNKKGLTTTMELYHYYRKREGTSMNISKQGYLQQRKKLNPNVFPYLNQKYLTDFYNSNEPVLWNNHLVLAIDGSKTEVPNSLENQQVFGQIGNDKSPGPARALISGVMDVFNDFFLDIQIGHIKTSETELAKENMKEIEKLSLPYPILVIFARGYPSLEFINFLEAHTINYLFRLSSNDYKREREAMDTQDELVMIEHTKSRMYKIQTKHPPEIVEQLKAKKKTKTRIINAKMIDKEITLMTNLDFKNRYQEILEVYTKRWQIEKKYHTLKNKMKWESVTGKSSIYVYQDYWAQLLVYNMIQDINHAASRKEKQEQKKYKNEKNINENIAIGLFKVQFLQILWEESPKERIKRWKALEREIENHLVPVRKTKNQKRKNNLSNKYKNNQKNSF